VVTTKTAGNKRIDQDKVTEDFATMEQRQTEILSDSRHRMSHTIDSYEMLGLEKPSAPTQAMRSIQGLDSSRYATMQTSFANEVHNGRDLYPTDLPDAVLKASRWMVSGRSSQESLRALAANKGAKDSKESKEKGKGKPRNDDKEKPPVKCDFCGRSTMQWQPVLSLRMLRCDGRRPRRDSNPELELQKRSCAYQEAIGSVW
jgi:hypothetical protein